MLQRLTTLVLAFGLFSVTAIAAEPGTCSSEEHYPLISKSELKQAAEGKTAVIFDVNSTESFAKAHVPGAIHFGSHQKDFARLLPQDKAKMIVAYCGGPQCGAWKEAARKACELGYTNIRHFKEGIKGWVASR